MAAANKADFRRIRELLEAGAEANCPNRNGGTPIMYAALSPPLLPVRGDAIQVLVTQARHPHRTMGKLVDLAGEPEQHRPALELNGRIAQRTPVRNRVDRSPVESTAPAAINPPDHLNFRKTCFTHTTK